MPIHNPPSFDGQNGQEPEVSAPAPSSPDETINNGLEASGKPVGPTVTQDMIPKRKKREGFKSIFGTLSIIIIAPIIALSLTAFVFQSYEVEGQSMETTLQNQDRLIVLKVARTWSKITRHPYIPNRGDVVIFNLNEPVEFGGPSKKQLIKRVIALPGEKVIVKNGIVTVYNSKYPSGFQPDKTLAYGNVIKHTSGDLTEVIPKDKVFVCGDNRDNSLDSRSFGSVPAKDIVGKMVMRIFPFNKSKVF